MKIDELPVELLVKIFSYLLTYKKVSLVSRRFYEVACEVNETNVFLTLDRNLFKAENLPRLQRILRSNRKISNVKIYFRDLTKENLRTVASIVSKFSTTIKYLRFNGGSIEVTYFFEIISLVPKAEHLLFERLDVSRAAKRQKIMSHNEDLNFKYLKILELCGCDEVFDVSFNRLPSGVLSELLLHGSYLPNLNTLFSRQTNIKEMTLSYCRAMMCSPLIFSTIWNWNYSRY